MQMSEKIKRFIQSKKGLGLRDIVSVGLIVVVSGIALGMGAKILNKIQSPMLGVTGQCNVTGQEVACLAVGNATSGVGELASWYPTIAIVIAAGIIIGVLVVAFRFR